MPFWEIASDSFLTAMDAGFCIQIVLFATPAPLPRLRYNEAVYHDLYQLGSWKESPGRQGNHFTVITRKVSPPEPFGSGGRSFFLQMVFEKRRTDGHFQTHRRHFSDDFYQESPCSQGLSWFRDCTNWGIGRPGRLVCESHIRAQRLHLIGTLDAQPWIGHTNVPYVWKTQLPKPRIAITGMRERLLSTTCVISTSEISVGSSRREELPTTMIPDNFNHRTTASSSLVFILLSIVIFSRYSF